MTLPSFTTFGELLKYLRRRARLTQRELSIAVGYSEGQINRLERNQRTPDMTTLLATFVPALGLEDEPTIVARLTELAAAARQESIPTGLARTQHAVEQSSGDKPLRLRSAVHRLPHYLTVFIGREQEMKGVTRLLAHSHLVTLTGAGGIGKTRLAIEVGAAMGERFADGVCLVELAPVSDPALVPQSIVAALHLPEQPGRTHSEALITYLTEKHLLLILDNCEHLIAVCADLADRLLRMCPRLQILATSREVLRLPGETVWRMSPLVTPDPASRLPVARLSEYAAVRLFTQQAVAAHPVFLFTDDNAEAVVQICHRLDGLPLAIEMAAAQVAGLSVQEIAAGLDDRFALLTSGSRTALLRQQTLRATLDWSYALLNPSEQKLLARLSVFIGGWTAEAAKAVSNEGMPVLLQLVHKSLVSAEPSNRQTRYHMLETIREYASEKLGALEEMTTLRERHLTYFLQQAEQALLHFRSPDESLWLAQLGVEYGNLRAALVWALANQQHASSARLGVALWRFWDIRGYYEEGWRWLQQILQLADQPEHRAHLLYGQGVLARRRGDTLAAIDSFAASVALFRALGDRRGIASALRGLGFVYYFRGDYRTARPLLEEALSLFRALDDQEGIAVTLDNLAYMTEELAEQQRLYQESLALRHRSGNLRGLTNSLANLAALAIDQADYTTARIHLQEHLQINETLGHQNGIANSLYMLGLINFAEGNYTDAQVLYEKSLQLCQATGDRALLHDPVLGLGVIALKGGAYEQAHERFEQALVLAQELGTVSNIALVLGYFACLALAQGQAQRALWLAGAKTTLCERRQIKHLWLHEAAFEHMQQVARQLLSESTATTAWTAGQALTLEQAIDYALARSKS
jgi:predicted ATPase/transcriptional regulator with XRE-family HTH domain